ncbi:TRAF-type zinc finger domain-containing protein 1 isoform 5, partial [Theobroma cacao]
VINRNSLGLRSNFLFYFIFSSLTNLEKRKKERGESRTKIQGFLQILSGSLWHLLRTKPRAYAITVACSLCSETMEREILAIHKGENCPQRIVTCEFCEFPLPAIDLAEHQEVCGNRTELCHLCNRYIRLRERYNHESRCSGVAENVGSSRDVRAAEREQGAQRRQPPEYSRRRLLFTIAITGIAVLLGSLFFQKKTETSQVH